MRIGAALDLPEPRAGRRLPAGSPRAAAAAAPAAPGAALPDSIAHRSLARLSHLSPPC